MNDPKVIIRINLDTLPVRLLILGLLAALLVGVVGSVAWAREGASPAEGGRYAPLAQGVSGRQYYLTISDGHLGNEALTACAAGYHMASLWELLDVSNMTYNTSLGYQIVGGDQGDGPPTDVQGWVRTGNLPSTGTGAPGTNNCGSYSQDSDVMEGTIVSLPNDWSTPGTLIGSWSATTSKCNTDQRVWCVED
ncbi:MAG: hypothetical protein CEE40_07445 [Chloroflexi bacterium B3_Chlor]|nr:MAG: hypothetical protein CEE40_07445 [Chloroflexi bacterium B3_Chlor]